MKKILPILAMFAMAACTPYSIYVSTGGDDSASGKRRAPLATLRAALDKASDYSLAHRGNAVEIVFGDGGYAMTGCVLVEGDRFAGPLTLRAGDGAVVVLSGERKTGPWQKLSDPGALGRVPYPEKIWQTDLGAAGLSDFGAAVGDSNRFDLYYDGRRQTLSRWPDEGFAYTGRHLGETRESPVLEYVDPRMDRWADEADPCFHGYWYFDWYDEYNKATFDVRSRSFTVLGRSLYGFRDERRFRGINLLCELDTPGEYWVDRSKGLLFWYAPEGFDGQGTAVSTLPDAAMLEFIGCTDVCVKGLAMCGGRGGAVIVEGGRNVVFEDCSFTRFAQDVAVVRGGQGHKFLHCHMYELGCAGIIMEGGDRTTLEPAGYEVADCTIESLSLYRKTYQPCIRFGGCGLSIVHNRFSDGPSSALRLDGNDILVESNQFENLVLESDDQGGIDIFNNYGFRGIVIRGNYFHNIGDPKDNIAGGVRFDDRISGMLVEGNVFDHCGSSGFGGVQIHGGQDNIVRGNVFYDCTSALSHSPWDADSWFSRSKNDCKLLGLTPELDSLTPMGKLYLERYPDMVHVFDTALVNRNYLTGNLVVKTPELILRGRNIESEGNIFIPDDSGYGLDHWTSDEVLESYGLSSVGLDKTGPRETSGKFRNFAK